MLDKHAPQQCWGGAQLFYAFLCPAVLAVARLGSGSSCMNQVVLFALLASKAAWLCLVQWTNGMLRSLPSWSAEWTV